MRMVKYTLIQPVNLHGMSLFVRPKNPAIEEGWLNIARGRFFLGPDWPFGQNVHALHK